MPVSTPETALLKAQIDLPAYIRSRGITLSPKGKALVGLCPWHEDRQPSLFITPARQLFHCFVCGIGGDVIRFVERLDGVSFTEAKRILADYQPGSFPQPASRPTSPPARPHVMQTEQKSPLLDPANQHVLKYAVRYYTKTLEQSTEARRYIESRKLIHPDLVTRFQMGCVDGALLTAIPDSRTKEGREIREKLLACGILNERGGRTYEHMKGRIVVPVIDEDGIIHQLYGRKLPVHGSTSPDHLYLPFPKNCVFNPRAFIARTLVVCEGPLDALSFYSSGIPNVTCTYSASDIPQAFLSAVEKGNVREVMIAFDGDDAGDRGAQKLAALLTARGIESLRMKFPTAEHTEES